MIRGLKYLFLGLVSAVLATAGVMLASVYFRRRW